MAAPSRRKPAVVGVVLLLLLLTLGSAVSGTLERPAYGASGDTGPDPAATALTPQTVTWLSPRLAEITFANPAVDPPLPTTKVRVLVPAGYATSAKRYPVVLLLHGIGDTSSAWTNNQDGWPTTLEAFTADKEVIVVMPDGGQDTTAGWYSDWYNDGAYGPPRWETYHLVQLLAYVDRTFPTRSTRAGRVVAGLSMGGFGAMSYAARHPDLFAGAFSFSGALDTTALVFTPGIWGLRASHEVRQRGHNPVDLADNLADTRVWFRTGMGQPGGPGPKDNIPGLEPDIWTTNERFAQALKEAKVTYTYESYPQGNHNWWHWQQGFQKAWPEMKKLFDTPAAPPASFRYRSMEPSFRIWGWEVEARRNVVEFLQLRDVSAARLVIEGSGAVAVATPGAYRPGRRYNLSAKGPTASVSPTAVEADALGRLRFAVTLGPSHTQQQYTAAQRAQAAADPAYWQSATVAIAAIPDAHGGVQAEAAPPTRSSGELPATGATPELGLAVALLASAGALRAARRRTIR